MQEKTPNGENKEFITQAEMLDNEESTIFAAPKEHTDKSQKNSPLKKIIAAVLAVAILGGAVFAAVKFIPKNTGEGPAVFEQGTLFTYQAKATESFSISNKNGEIVVTGDLRKETLESDAAQTRHFTLLGYNEELIDHDKLAALIESALTFQYFTSYESKDLAQFGLDEPIATVKAKGNDFDVTIKYGIITADSARCYAWTSAAPDSVFVVATSKRDEVNVSAFDLAISTKIPAVAKNDKNSKYFTEDVLDSFDSLVISGSKIKEPITIKPNTDEKFSALATYITTTPKQRIADDVVSILNIFSEGLTSSGVVSFDQSEQSLNKFGLKDPEFMLTLRLGGETHTVRLAMSKENKHEYYVASSLDKMIRTVSEASVEFVLREEKDYYILFTVLESITDLNRLTLSGEVNADFSIDYDTTEEVYIIKNGEKDVAESVFKTAYQDLIATVAIDIETVNTNKKPSLTVKLYHKDGSAPTTLSFTKVSETRYQYSVGGVPMGKITSTGYNVILKSFKKASGE